MRYHTILAMLAIVFFVSLAPVPSASTQAQSDPWWEDGCDVRVLDELASLTDVVDYRAGCDTYRTCDPSGRGEPACQMEALQVMLDQCEAGDSFCEDGAILYAAAMLVYDLPFGESIDWRPPQVVIDNVPAGLSLYWQIDAPGALIAFDSVLRSDYPEDVMMPISRGILNSIIGETEQAEAEFSSVLSAVFDSPLMRFARARHFARLDNSTEAAIDVIALDGLIPEDSPFRATLAPLQAAYPLDALEDWLLYPLSSTSIGPVGTFVSDNSLRPARPVQLAMLPELDMVVGVGLQSWIPGNYDGLGPLLQQLTSTEDGAFRILYPGQFESSGSLTLRFDSDNTAASGEERISFFEGASTWSFYITPPDAADPRPLMVDEARRYCEGGVRSIVDTGDALTIVSFFGIEIFDAPAGEPIGMLEEFGVEFVATDGPECVGSDTWWQAEDGSGTFWFQENDGTTYMVRQVAP